MSDTLAGILAAPVRLIRWLLTHPKTLIMLGIIVFGLIMLRNCAAQREAVIVETPGFQKIAPSVSEAPYLVQTSSRVYYVVKYDNTGDILLLTEYYTYDREEWQRQTVPLPLDRQYYGEVRIDARKH